MSPRSALWALLLLPACTGCKEEPEPAIDLIKPLASKATGMVVGTGVGNASEVRMPVYTVNAYGAMIPSESISLSSSVALDATTVTPDAAGYGVAVLRPGALGVFSLTAAGEGGTGEGRGYATAAEPPDIEFSTLPSANASFMANAGNGLAWSVEGQVWWALPNGQPPLPVLTLEDPILTLFPVQGDKDGVTDLLVASRSAVVLLKGLDGGGLAWGAGFTADDPILAVTMADMDGNAVNDLLIATAPTDTTSEVVWMEGDGLWAFKAVNVLEVTYTVHGVSAEDYNGDRQAEVTLLTDDGLLRRYTPFEDQWLSATTQDYDLGLGQGSHLYPSIDVNGDKSPDILAWGPLKEGEGWQAWIITAGSSSPTRYRLFEADKTPEWIGMTIGDLTGDGLLDVALTTPTQLMRAVWGKKPNEAPTIYVTTSAPTSPAVAIGSWIGDDYPDVGVGAAEVVILPGDFTPDDPSTTETNEYVPWRVKTPQGDLYDAGMALDPWLGDVNDDGIVDIVAAIQADTSVGIRAYIGRAEDGDTGEQPTAAPLVPLASAGTALDLAVCGDQVYFLLDAGTQTLYHYSVAADGVLSPMQDPIEVPGASLVACGSFLAGDVVVADPAGHTTYIDADGFANDGEPSNNVTAMVAVDPDADGVASLRQCSEAGCRMGAADFDGDGSIDLATLSNGTLEVEIAGTSYSASEDATGLWVGDADGDGTADVVVGGAGYWRVYRVFAGGITPGDGHYVWWPISDQVSFGDLDGNGVPDLLCGAAPDTNDSDAVDWTGRLVYVEAPDAE